MSYRFSLLVCIILSEYTALFIERYLFNYSHEQNNWPRAISQQNCATPGIRTWASSLVMPGGGQTDCANYEYYVSSRMIYGLSSSSSKGILGSILGCNILKTKLNKQTITRPGTDTHDLGTCPHHKGLALTSFY